MRREFKLEGNKLIRLNGKYAGEVTSVQVGFEGKKHNKKRIIEILKTPS